MNSKSSKNAMSDETLYLITKTSCYCALSFSGNHNVSPPPNPLPSYVVRPYSVWSNGSSLTQLHKKLHWIFTTSFTTPINILIIDL